MLFGVMFAGLVGMFRGVDQVPVGHDGVMGGLLKILRAMELGGQAMVLRGVLQKLSGLQMMIDTLLRHDAFRITSGVYS